MFKKSTPIQKNLFSSTEEFLSGQSLNIYTDTNSWHNLFRREVTFRVDENLFKILYDSDMGAPNSPIRILFSMMVLKESQGWSDAHLFEQCRFNILTRSALGLMNMDDVLPVESTYYLFRKLITEHERNTGVNLFQQAFSQITGAQIKEYNIQGKQVRMDSFLLGSNIVWYSRYELIHETLRLFLKKITDAGPLAFLTEDERALTVSIASEKGDKVVYRSSKEEVVSRLERLGVLIYKLLSFFKDEKTKALKTLETVFSQQFSINEESGQVLPLPKEQIKADSVQSPHDTDCTYRNKDGNQVKGYSINITETCDQNPDALNLITNLQVEKAGFADNDFFVPSIENSAEILPEKIGSVYTDGAYHSVDNEVYSQENGMAFIRGGMQGACSRYDLFEGETPEEIRVFDKETQTYIPVEKTYSKKDNSLKWRIKVTNPEGKTAYRYFTRRDLETAVLRRKLAQIPQSELNIRNNVEAAVFQMTFHYSNDKSCYRTLCKHKMWAVVRALWVNFRRILKYVKQICQRTLFSGKNTSGYELSSLFLPIIILWNTIFLKNKKYQVTF